MRTPSRCSVARVTSLAAITTVAAFTPAHAKQTPATPAEPVDAVAVPAPPPVFTPAQPEMPLQRPNHPPIDEIPPMPMPFGDAGPLIHSDPGAIWIRDAETGADILVDPPAGQGLPFGNAPGFVGADGVMGADDLFPGRGFNDMYTISGTDAHPWRMNVKLVMHFVDQNGVDRWFVGSGSMADAETVLTAGHCVYARNPNGIPIWDWADEIYVYAGWDGVGNQWSAPSGVINPYGYARGTYYLTFTGWSQDGNFDWDMGLIRLTRGVGMMTGWFGWAYGGDCGPIQDLTYHNASFPAENCPLNGLHNGRDMYYWYGSFDSCPGNQLQINTGGGNCFDTVWGGMSGSAAYYIDGDSRYAHAVCSNSNRTTSGRYAKMWESFKDAMVDFENEARGADFDLQALNCRVAPDTATAGDSLTDRTHLAINPTNGSKNATFSFEVYLSTNDNISTGDTLLSTQNYSRNFGAMTSVNVNMATITIPYNTPSGDYWVGVVYDAATDGNFGNNDTDIWDADPITINGVADLDVLTVDVAPGNYQQGDPLQINYSLENLGGDPSNTITVDFYASTNTFISPSDTLLGSTTHSGLAGGGSISTNRTYNIPNSLEGLYYIGIIVSASDDVDTSNNSGYDRTAINVLADCPADLDGDGFVGQSDLGILLSAYGQNAGGDIDGDGDTDQSDLGILLA
ncbi:MAG: CARDB domain-containing protein, partial [Phycisphaerales bacterium JB038]